MTLPGFEIHRPDSYEEATELALRFGVEGIYFCGGTELLLLMKFGFADYTHLIDLKRVAGIDGIRTDGDHLTIGAGATHREIERSPEVVGTIPSLAEMEKQVANLRVRNVGTLGGNLSFSDPHSDPSTYLLVTGAALELRAGAGSRMVEIEDFVAGPFQTVLDQGEILASVILPIPAPSASIVHRKLSFHERPAVTVTSLVDIQGGCIEDARVAVGSVGVMPTRCRSAEEVMRGHAASDVDAASLHALGEAAGEAVRPVADSNGSVEYKQHLVSVLTTRTFTEALSAHVRS